MADSRRPRCLPTAEALGAGYAASGSTATAAPLTLRSPAITVTTSGGGIWPWLAGFLILLLLAGGAAAYLLTRPDKVQVPIVVSLSQSIAQARIESAGLSPNVIYQNSPDEPGTVIDQSPLGGTHVDKGSAVTLTISNGPGNVDIPSIVQLPKDEAIRAAQIGGLKVARILNENSPQVPVGEATRTDPPAGSSVQSGSGVTLYLSSGRAPINVPYVTGDQLTAAQAVLGRFAVKVVNKPSDTASAGHGPEPITAGQLRGQAGLSGDPDRRQRADDHEGPAGHRGHRGRGIGHAAGGQAQGCRPFPDGDRGEPGRASSSPSSPAPTRSSRSARR